MERGWIDQRPRARTCDEGDRSELKRGRCRLKCTLFDHFKNIARKQFSHFFTLASFLKVLTFIIVVLHCDDASSGGLGVVDDGLGVQRFDGERVNHADVDSF